MYVKMFEFLRWFVYCFNHRCCYKLSFGIQEKSESTTMEMSDKKEKTSDLNESIYKTKKMTHLTNWGLFD